jgi:hypothetical protein
MISAVCTARGEINACSDCWCMRISEVPASNSYRRLPDFSERFSYRDATPKSSSIEVQGKVEFPLLSMTCIIQ